MLDDPLDGRDGRLTKAERRATLADQLLADRALSASRKRRFEGLQGAAAAAAAKGKRRKTEQPRNKRAHHRPKH